MSHRVWPVKSVERVIDDLDKRTRRKFDAAVEQLKGEGCRAGGKRMRGVKNEDARLCQRDITRNLRLVMAFLPGDLIVLIGLGPHDGDVSEASKLAETFPDLSATGRKRSDQPPCCDELDAPPILTDEEQEFLRAAFNFV